MRVADVWVDLPGLRFVLLGGGALPLGAFGLVFGLETLPLRAGGFD